MYEKYGVDCSLPDNDECGALMFAYWNGHLNTLKFLLEFNWNL